MCNEPRHNPGSCGHIHTQHAHRHSNEEDLYMRKQATIVWPVRFRPAMSSGQRRRRAGTGSAKTVAAFALVVAFFLVVSAGALAAPPWPDASDSWWLSNYGVTEAQVGAVADGFEDGVFRPGLSVTRGQLAKMVVSGLGLPVVEAAEPTFQDVSKGSTFYQYIEGACAEGLIIGYHTAVGRCYRPSNGVSRQQANTILGRYLSLLELDETGAIHGDVRDYGSLEGWYGMEGKFYLGCSDCEEIAPEHRAATAYLRFREVLLGSADYLRPTATLNRAQAAAMIVRASEAAVRLTVLPAAPVLLGTSPHNTEPGNWCSDARPVIEGSAAPLSEVYVFDADCASWVAAGYADSTGHVSLRVHRPLSEGSHELVARARDSCGLESPSSKSLIYGVDTRPPKVTITCPRDEDVYRTCSCTPSFVADGVDEPGTAGAQASGIASVDFLYVSWGGAGQYSTWDEFTLISSSCSPPYEAVYPSSGLPGGYYLLAVRATDGAGNLSPLLDGSDYAAGVTQRLVIDDGG